MVYRFSYTGGPFELVTPLKCGLRRINPGVEYTTEHYEDIVKVSLDPSFKIIPSEPEPAPVKEPVAKSFGELGKVPNKVVNQEVKLDTKEDRE